LITSYFVFVRVVPGPVAVAIVAMLALSQLCATLGQQARPYALIAALTSLNFLSFLQILDCPDDRKPLI